jgi:signal recognition particle subunit SRP54
MNPGDPLSFGSFASQIREMRRMGPITRILKMLPESIKKLAEGIDENQINAEFDNVELLASVMTPEELQDPEFIPDSPRLRQLARKAEVPVEEADQLFEQLEAARRFLSGDGPSPLDL